MDKELLLYSGFGLKMASSTGGKCEGKAGGEASSKLPQASTASESGLLGLAAASTAITLAVCEPPPPPPLGFNKATYLVSLSGVFFAGVTQIAASVQAAGGRPLPAGRKLVYACLVAPAAAAGAIAVASLLTQ